MYAEVDKDRVRRLARELLEAIGDEESAEGSPRKGKNELLREIAEEETPYTTVELARLLGVSQAWVSSHVSDFPGAFRLSEGQRANYRFPRKSVEEYIKKRAV